ncbi:MAG TPA: VanZ family protein [Polyangiaceae bacterium]
MSFRAPSSFATRVLPAIVCTALIFYGGLIRIGPLPQVGQVPSDKVGHALVFGGLAGLFVSAIRFLFRALSGARSVLFAVALASALGALLELCQMLVTYRSAEFMDWVADTVGTLLVGLALQVWLRGAPANAR